jgi:serine/threonine-protein kinase
VKFIATELVGNSPELVARFNREAMAAAMIKSPHVVQILDHGMMRDGTPYIVMELLEGEDLGARLDRGGKLTMAEAVSVVSQVAKALTRAHAVGIVHRDIKPDNIFIVRQDDDDELFVKVLDFGIAKHTRQTSHSVVTVTGTLVGTPAYMSPEQVLSGKHVDARSDLWSLGVVAYHALTGEIPFEGATLGALCVAISRGTFVAPSYLEATLPASIDEWMNRALAQLPDHRFQSAKELADALRAAAACGPIAVDDVGAFSRPSSDFGGAHAPADDWDAPPSSSLPPRGRSAPLPESVLVVPKNHLVTKAVVVGGAALVVGVLGAAAFLKLGGGGRLSQAAAGPDALAPVERAQNAEPPAHKTTVPAPSAMSRDGEVPADVGAAAPRSSARVEAPVVEASAAPALGAPARAAKEHLKPTHAPPVTPRTSQPAAPVPPTDGPATSVDRGF